MSEHCVFCQICEGTAPGHVVDQDEHTVAFLDINPFTRGHTLVVPRQHHEDLWDVPQDVWQHVSRMTHRVAQRLRDRLDPDGMNLFQATKSIAWQTVFHIHVHVIPRYDDDTMGIPTWPKPHAPDEELAQVLDELS
ncbi:MAG: HIT family protein [Nitriliruptorales bacterium]|nr:HIT family protein [Nitriliruptorales bacterium]